MIRILSILLIFISLQSWADEIDYELIKEKGIYLKCEGYKEVVFLYPIDEKINSSTNQMNFRAFKEIQGCSSEICRKDFVHFLIYMPTLQKPILDTNSLQPLNTYYELKWDISENFISAFYDSDVISREISLNLITGEYKENLRDRLTVSIEKISTICEQIPNKLKFSTSKLFGLIQ